MPLCPKEDIMPIVHLHFSLGSDIFKEYFWWCDLPNCVFVLVNWELGSSSFPLMCYMMSSLTEKKWGLFLQQLDSTKSQNPILLVHFSSREIPFINVLNSLLFSGKTQLNKQMYWKKLVPSKNIEAQPRRQFFIIMTLARVYTIMFVHSSTIEQHYYLEIF